MNCVCQRHGTLAGSLALLVAGLWPLSATAAPGDHIRVGAFEIAPTLSVGSEFRTNVFRRETDPVSAANLDLATGLGVSAEGDDHLLRLGGRWELNKFYFVGQQQAGVPRPNGERLQSLDRFDTGSASFSADTFRRSRIGFRIHDNLSVRNTTADAEWADLPYTTHVRNAAGADLRLSTSSAFAFVPGGTWAIDDFRVPVANADADRSLNLRNTYGPDFGLNWRFLPNTALVLDSNVRFNRWRSNVLESNAEDEPEIEIPDSTFFKARAGIDGQFTRKLFAKALLGYGIANYQGQSDLARQNVRGLDGLLALFAVRYDLTPPTGDRPGSRLSFRYVRDFSDSFFSNYLALNAFNVEYAARFGRLEPALRYSLRFERYRGELERSDVVNQVGLDVRTPLKGWALLSVGGWWQQRASDTANVEYDDFHFRVSTAFSY